MRYLLVLLILSRALSAQTIRPDQVRGTASVTAPSGDQTIVQPFGTTLSVNSLNTVVNAAMFTGSDIGAKINASIAALPNKCGTVIVPASSTPYSFRTTINLHRCDILKGSSARPTELAFTGENGVAILVSDADGTSIYARGHIDDLVLTGPNIGTAVGVYFGGDPACTGKCTTNPSMRFGDNFSIYNSKIQFFDVGVQWGNHAFLDSFFSTTIGNNRVGLFFNSNLFDSGEAISFHGSSIVNSSQVGMSLGGYGDFYFYGLGCDYNLGGCALLEGAAQVQFIGTHFEQGGGTFIHVQTSTDPRLTVSVQTSSFVASKTTGTDTSMIAVDNPNSLSLSVNHSLIFTEHAYTNFLAWTPTGFSPLSSSSVDLTGNTGLFGNPRITNVMSTPCRATTNFLTTCITRRAIFTSTVSLASVPANSCSQQDLLMSGFRAGDIPISMIKSTFQAGLVVQVNSPGADDHPGVVLCNITAVPIVPTVNDLYTLIIQR